MSNLKSQLEFERLLTDISAQFVALPSDQLDSEIRNAQRRLCEYLGIELCVLWQLSPDGRSLHLTHIYAPEDFVPVPEVLDAREYFPWFLEKMLKKEVILAHTVSHLPESAKKDREGWMYYGIKSSVTFPLWVGEGPVFGSLTFCDLNQERYWPEDLANRLRLMGQIFSNALSRKMNEVALRESEARLSLATEAAKAGLWMVCKDTGLFWATDRAKEIFQFSVDEEISIDKFTSAVYSQDRARIQKRVEESFQTGADYFEEYRVFSQKSGVSWVSVRARLIQSCLIGVVVDISERKKNEGEMQRLRDELMHVSRVVTLNELSTSIAHEINQPLTAILNNAETALHLLSKKKIKSGEMRSILEDIVQDNIRASNVIQHLRALLKKKELEFSAVDTLELIQETVRLMQGEAIMRKKSIVIECEEILPSVYGDRIQIQQVLMNLITNALEAMGERESGATKVLIGSKRENKSYLTIFVSDSGPGIFENCITHIFEPFYTTKTSGLGMGLPISRSIVEAHGGKLEVRNNPEGGATFFFTLPLSLKSTHD